MGTITGHGMTAADVVARHARTTPDGPALADPRTSRTWAQLDDRVSRLATVLADRGVDRGDRVEVGRYGELVITLDVDHSFPTGTSEEQR